MLVDFLKIVVILRAKWALQGSRVEGSRARALFGPEPARAQARLVQTLLAIHVPRMISFSTETEFQHFQRPKGVSLDGPLSRILIAFLGSGHLYRGEKRFLRGCEKFHPALA